MRYVFYRYRLTVCDCSFFKRPEISRFKAVGLFFFLLLLGACSAAPPSRHSVTHNAILDREGGVLLIVDVCIQRDAIGESDDYFVIEESRVAAESLLSVLRSHVRDSNISVRGEISAVCAAKHATKDSILAADHIKADTFKAQQPLYVQQAIKDDSEYIDAISTISTYAFERAAVNAENTTVAESGSISRMEFLAAAEVIKYRTQASSVMFVGVLGTSMSGGKRAAGYISSVFVGAATGVATAGLGTGYYLVFVPGQQLSGRFMEGALIDLESGDLTWSNAVKAGGDPLNAETWLNLEPLDLLFHDLLFQKTNTQ